MSLTAEELDVCRAWLGANRYRVAYLPHRLRWVAADFPGSPVGFIPVPPASHLYQQEMQP